MNSFQSLRPQHHFPYSDESFLHEYRFTNGQPFPRSYIDYVHTLGYGELCGSFQIFIPLGDHHSSWLHQYYSWRNWFDEILESEVVLQEAAMASEGSKELFEYAAPFARSKENHLLFWDIRSLDNNGEYPIYTVNTDHWDHQATCRYVSDHLYGCVELLVNQDHVQRLFGIDRHVYPYQFQPFGY